MRRIHGECMCMSKQHVVLLSCFSEILEVANATHLSFGHVGNPEILEMAPTRTPAKREPLVI